MLNERWKWLTHDISGWFLWEKGPLYYGEGYGWGGEGALERASIQVQLPEIGKMDECDRVWVREDSEWVWCA